MSNLIPSFRDSVLKPLSDPAIDYLDAGIDLILEADALKAVPIVGAVSAFCKIGVNLHERNLLKQTFEFIKGFNEGSIDKETVEAHRLELENDPSKQEKELTVCCCIFTDSALSSMRLYLLLLTDSDFLIP